VGILEGAKDFDFVGLIEGKLEVTAVGGDVV